MLSFAQEKLNQMILKVPFQPGAVFYVNSALNRYNRVTLTSVCKTNTQRQHPLKDWSKNKQAQSYTLHCNRFPPWRCQRCCSTTKQQGKWEKRAQKVISRPAQLQGESQGKKMQSQQLHWSSDNQQISGLHVFLIQEQFSCLRESL